MFQGFNLIPVLTALEMLALDKLDMGFVSKEYFPYYYRVPYRLYTSQVLDAFDLEDNKYISGGANKSSNTEEAGASNTSSSATTS